MNARALAVLALHLLLDALGGIEAFQFAGPGALRASELAAAVTPATDTTADLLVASSLGWGGFFQDSFSGCFPPGELFSTFFRCELSVTLTVIHLAGGLFLGHRQHLSGVFHHLGGIRSLSLGGEVFSFF